MRFTSNTHRDLQTFLFLGTSERGTSFHVPIFSCEFSSFWVSLRTFQVLRSRDIASHVTPEVGPSGLLTHYPGGSPTPPPNSEHSPSARTWTGQGRGTDQSSDPDLQTCNYRYPGADAPTRSYLATGLHPKRLHRAAKSQQWTSSVGSAIGWLSRLALYRGNFHDSTPFSRRYRVQTL